MKCVNHDNDVIKILRICYSYDKKMENENNIINHVIKFHSFLNMCRMRNFFFLGKVSILKVFELIHTLPKQLREIIATYDDLFE